MTTKRSRSARPLIALLVVVPIFSFAVGAWSGANERQNEKVISARKLPEDFQMTISQQIDKLSERIQELFEEKKKNAIEGVPITLTPEELRREFPDVTRFDAGWAISRLLEEGKVTMKVTYYLTDSPSRETAEGKLK